MGITEPHPDGARDLPVTHVYRHPAGHGLGRHHAGEDLAGRPADPGLPLEHLMPEFRVSMHDLDLHDGTGLSHAATDEDTGHLIFAWTDSQGNPRRTAFTPEQAGRFLTASDTEGRAG